LDLSVFSGVFKNQGLRSAAFGYFGHMWELYAFWAFVPVLISTYNNLYPLAMLNVPILSFSVIGIGGLGSVAGGYLSLKLGSKKVASTALMLSGICCLCSPFIFLIDSKFAFAGILLFWGIVVLPDSPQFSTLVAQNASPETKGTALTMVNCIGFSITIISIQLLNVLRETIDLRYIYLILALGPTLGLLALRENKKAA
jgi:MFS-type transporter involved in bile tolerance (Atg22 family)